MTLIFKIPHICSMIFVTANCQMWSPTHEASASSCIGRWWWWESDHHHSQPPSSLLSLGKHVHMAQEAKSIFEPLTTDGSCGSRLWKDLPWTTISSRIIMNNRLKHGMHFGHQIFRVYSQKIYTSWSFCQAWVAVCNWVMNCRISAVNCIYKSMHSNVIYGNRSSTEWW